MAEVSAQMNTMDSAGKRLWIYPSDVSGRYRRRRTWISGVLVLLFLVLPWIRVGGQPALLLDIAGGRFSVFGLRFWSHDTPILFFIAAGAAVTLAFVTSIWGRLWCGWACPQTVFVDIVFRRVERWIEGDGFRRRRRDQGPWTGEKVLKKSVKWTLYLLIALVVSHSFLGYFVGTDALAEMIRQNPSHHLGSFIAMAGLTAAVLFDFGWLREQFCTLVCPYGRFQSVLMDERSLAVKYDRARGEPRRGLSKPAGDCVNCFKCVQVCPTGIDIRNGLQMECIACTACIDACDTVMKKQGKKPGLIRYASVRSKFLRPALYLGVLALLGGSLGWVLMHREPAQITLIRKVGAPYEEILRAGLPKEVVNSFKLDLMNQTYEPITVQLGALAELRAKGIELVAPSLPAVLQAGESRRVDLLIRFPMAQIKEGKGSLAFEILTISRGLSAVQIQEVPLVGPLR